MQELSKIIRRIVKNGVKQTENVGEMIDLVTQEVSPRLIETMEKVEVLIEYVNAQTNKNKLKNKNN